MSTTLYLYWMKNKNLKIDNSVVLSESLKASEVNKNILKRKIKNIFNRELDIEIRENEKTIVKDDGNVLTGAYNLVGTGKCVLIGEKVNLINSDAISKQLTAKQILNLYKDNIILSNSWPLLGVDISALRGKKMHMMESMLDLKQFEVQQNKFEELIYRANELDIWIKFVEFSSELSNEEEDDLNYYLRNRKINSILNFIDDQRYEMKRDIYEVTFSYGLKYNELNNITVKLSREAVLSADCIKNNINTIMTTEPIGILSGMVYSLDSKE